MNMMTKVAAQAAAPLLAREFGRKAAGDGNDAVTLEQVQKNLDQALGHVKEVAVEFRAKSAEGTKISEEAKEKADKALVELTSIRGDINELSQKLAQGRRGGGDDTPEMKSLGYEVARHAD
ncbi:hypothetical protein LTR94_031847, partial [Friedmanniomyces endolithicus]